MLLLLLLLLLLTVFFCSSEVCLRLNCSEDHSEVQTISERERERARESAAKFTGSGKFFNSFLLPLLILLLSRRTRGSHRYN